MAKINREHHEFIVFCLSSQEIYHSYLSTVHFHSIEVPMDFMVKSYEPVVVFVLLVS